MGYSVRLRCYDPWAKEIMTLACFKQFLSKFHTEAGTFDNENIDKYHQL